MLRLFPGTLGLVCFACLAVGATVTPQKRPLDHEAHARWHTLEGSRISTGGNWVSYALEPGDSGDGRLEVRAVTGDAQHTIERGTGGRISWDERWMVCKVAVPRTERHAAELDETSDDEAPKAGLALLNLETGQVETVERVKSFALPGEDGRFVAWLQEKPLEDEDSEQAEEEAGEVETEEPAVESSPLEQEQEQEPVTEAEAEPEHEEDPTPEEQEAERKDKLKKKRKQDGTTLVLRDLGAGTDRQFEHVTTYTFSEDGRWLAYLTNNKDADEDVDGAWVVSTAGGEPNELLGGYGQYAHPVFDEAGEHLAFLSNTADWEAGEPAWSLYLWTPGDSAATSGVHLVAGPVAAGAGVRASLPEG